MTPIHNMKMIRRELLKQPRVNMDHFVCNAELLAERFSPEELDELARPAHAFRGGMAFMRCIFLGFNFLAIMALAASSFDKIAAGPGHIFFLFLSGVILALVFNFRGGWLTIYHNAPIDHEEVAAARRLQRRALRAAREAQREAFGLPSAR